jgi:signal transduction histidine kinase/response regulator of citrate/malate metabolism
MRFLVCNGARALVDTAAILAASPSNSDCIFVDDIDLVRATTDARMSEEVIVIVTSDPTEIAELYTAGADEVVLWPRDADDLARIVARVGERTPLRRALVSAEQHDLAARAVLSLSRVLSLELDDLGRIVSAQGPRSVQLTGTRFRDHFVDAGTIPPPGRVELPRHFDAEWRTDDGAVAHMVWNAARDPETGVLRVVGHDVTALRAAEREARAASEKANEASRIKSQFLANMSHEIRTPMNGVLGMTALALDTQLTPEQREYMEAVQTSAESLLAIINDILDISKIEAGKLTIEQIEFSLQRTLDTALVPLLSRAAQKNLVLEVAVAPGTADALVGDPLRLRQVLVNLVGNAIKFTKEGGVFVCVSEGDGPDSLHFSVADTGVGIAQDKVALVFEPFRQSDESTARNYGGTGLGLAICKELVELMGGRIWLESELGAGSQFHFEVPLPKAQAPVKDDAPSVPAAMPLSKLRVLVAEDNAVNTKLAMRFLQKLDCEAVHVENGALAADRVRDEDFDVVLMDVQMPVMDGLEATRLIRERERQTGDHVPIIALTASAMKGDADMAIAAGMDAYLSKPLDLAALRQSLSRIGHTEKAPVPSSPFVMYSEADAMRTLTACGNEEDLFLDVIREFRADWPRVFDELQRSLEAGSANAVMRAAHRLKGALLAMSAGRGSHLAQLIEEAGRGGDTSQCGGLADTLSRELTHCDAVLADVASRLEAKLAPALDHAS